MSADFEDWTRGLELVVDDMSDFPDWTVAAQVTGGGGTGYASLTGPGQTVTPGALTQAGEFTVNSGGASLVVGATSGPFTDVVNISTDTEMNLTAGGFTLDTNTCIVTTSLTGLEVTMDAGFDFVSHNGLIVQEGMAVTYGIGGAGATSGDGLHLTDIGVASTQVCIMVHHGNPNGAITPPGGFAGFCIDTATPKLWVWAQGAAVWTGV